MTVDIDAEFAGLDEVFYPGSKRKRREPVAVTHTDDSDAWDSHPQIKRLPNGNEVEMFTAGALAAEFGRPLVKLRMWESRGYIPTAPYRLPGHVRDGKKHAGRRLYTRSLIERTVELFADAGVLKSKRVEWSRHTDLSIRIIQEWKNIHEIENA